MGVFCDSWWWWRSAGFSLVFYFLPSAIFSQLTHFAPFLVQVAAFSVQPFCPRWRFPFLCSAVWAAPPQPFSSSSSTELLSHGSWSSPPPFKGWEQPECIRNNFHLLWSMLQHPQLVERCQGRDVLLSPINCDCVRAFGDLWLLYSTTWADCHTGCKYQHCFNPYFC